MMTSQCGCHESHAKLEGLVATLRVMQASLDVLGEQIDHMLVVAQKEQNRAAQVEEPHAESELNCLVDEELHAEVGDQVDTEVAASETAGDVEPTISDSDADLPAPIIGFSVPDAPTCEIEVEPDIAPDEAEGEKACIAAASSDTTGETELGDQLEADVRIVEPVCAEVDESVEVHEEAAAEPARDVDPIAKAMAASEKIRMIRPEGVAAMETETETKLEAEAPVEQQDKLEGADGESTEAEVEQDSIAQAAEDAKNVVILASRRRRIYRRLAASVLVALVVAGAVVATRVEALDGLTSLALANGLR